MSLVTFAIFEAHVSCMVFPQPIFCKGEKGTLLTFLRLNNNRVFGRNRICIQQANLFGRWATTCAYCEHYMVNDTKKKLDLQVLINSNRFQLNRFLCHNHSLAGWNRWKICCRRGSLQILGTFSFHTAAISAVLSFVAGLGDRHHATRHVRCYKWIRWQVYHVARSARTTILQMVVGYHNEMTQTSKCTPMQLLQL